MSFSPGLEQQREGVRGEPLGLTVLVWETLGPQLQDPAWTGETAGEGAFREAGGPMILGESPLFSGPPFPPL